MAGLRLGRLVLRLLVSLILAIVPGTGVVFTLACAMSQGMRGAVWGAVAGAVGVIPHLVAAGLGLSALLIAWPLMYDGLRILGGAYLLWLAVQAWRHRHDTLKVGSVTATGTQIVTQGALINLLNPKLTLFFVSFLPQFVPPTDPAPMLTMGLMGLVLVIGAVGYVLDSICLFLIGQFSWHRGDK